MIDRLFAPIGAEQTDRKIKARLVVFRVSGDSRFERRQIADGGTLPGKLNRHLCGGDIRVRGLTFGYRARISDA